MGGILVLCPHLAIGVAKVTDIVLGLAIGGIGPGGADDELSDEEEDETSQPCDDTDTFSKSRAHRRSPFKAGMQTGWLLRGRSFLGLAVWRHRF